MMIQTHARKTS